MGNDLTQGKIGRTLFRFAVPYLLSCFLQTFYGLADLFIVGQFNGASSITGVSIGSQLTHMLTVMIVGLAMGGTVTIGRAVGEGDWKKVARSIGNTASVFFFVALFGTVGLLLSTDWIIGILKTPSAAVGETRGYLVACFWGVPFIVAYNVVSSIFRGLGDSASPMYFVAIAGVINIVLDYVLIGVCGMGASGAGYATVLAQAVSVGLGVWMLLRRKLGVTLTRGDVRFERGVLRDILKVGIPISLQDGFIQISFLVITMIANSRGLEVSAAVGIVEKVICFVFLVPSAMLSSVSAIVAQNAGAGLHGRGREVLWQALCIVLIYGGVVMLACQWCAEGLVGLFISGESRIVELGGQYLRGYAHDCYMAGIHFCFSGYFCAYRLAGVSFLHNVVSIVAARIPGAYLASIWWPETLYPMGVAVPVGSAVSVVVCVLAYMYYKKRGAFA